MKYIKKNRLNVFPIIFIIVLIFSVNFFITKKTNIKNNIPEEETLKESLVYLEVGELKEEEGRVLSEDTIFEEDEEITTELNETDFDIHVVKSGENLSSIAKKWGVTVLSILEINEIEDADSIKIGQELKIPLRDQWNSDYPEDDGLYRVKKGDSLWKIAKDFDTTVDILLDLNPELDPAKLQPGQMINVPKKTQE
tara:strand:- start:2757 stop:3344 length:588 start_codon:yes stop_codon:yes gene_type:complete